MVAREPENNPLIQGTSTPTPLTRQQSEVFELLREFSSERDKYHEWYQGSLQVLDSSSPDKIAQAANSIRELCDRLPKRIANIPEPKSVISAAKSLGPDFIKVKKDSYSDGWDGKIINESLGGLLVRFEKICNEPPRTKRLKSALTASDPQAEFLSKALRDERDEVFNQLVKFFQSTTHHHHLATEPEFRERLGVLESLLLNYLTPCTASQQKELLALISGPADRRALTRVNELIRHKGANFVFFFDRLDNPNWLPLLVEEGHFSDLPEPEPIENGRLFYRHHFPLIVLTKLAGITPQPVTSILLKLRLPDNPYVGDQVLQSMAKIHDLACIQQLRPIITQLGENSRRTSWLWIQELFKSWVELKAFPEAFTVAEAYLRSAVESSFDKRHDDSNEWLVKQVDEDFLGPQSVEFPLEVATITFRALCKWADQERSKYPKSELTDDAPLSYLLEDFKSPPPSHRGFENSLAIRLFSAAEQIHKAGNLQQIEEVDKMLRSHPWQLFRRLRWQLYANFPLLSLHRARAEIIERIPNLNKFDLHRGGHDYEFAQLLHVHSKAHRDSFLSAEEVEEFFDIVQRGPIDADGALIEDYKEVFWRKQLWPIAGLLKGDQLIAYRTLVPDDSKIEFESYKPHRFGGSESHFVRQTAPPEADTLELRPDEEIWKFLNTWEPKTSFDASGSQEQDIFALGTKFADLVERQPERFNPEREWWKNINRWEILNTLLDRASHRVTNKEPNENGPIRVPSDQDWANWLGIVEWMMNHKGEEITDSTEQFQIAATPKKWPRDAVAKFIEKVLESTYSLPDHYFLSLPNILQNLIEEEDPRLTQAQNSFGDWLTTAINSVRGDSIDALLNLALRQKKAGQDIESWIFKLIRCRLEFPQESPAIFALLGSKLRFLIYLFERELKECPSLLLPPAQPLHCAAAITAHFNYDRPYNLILTIFPDFIKTALATLEAMRAGANDDEAKQNRRDFGSQLGTHIACYYWNGSFLDDAKGEAALDRFFAVASGKTRGIVINQIATIWEKPSKEKTEEKTLDRVMRIWERRYAQIESSIKDGMPTSEYESELSESIDWLNCDCFPFEWRFTQAKRSLDRLEKAPRSYRLLKAISEFGLIPDRLERMLQLFHILLQKPSDELRWSIQFKDLAPVISLGLASENPTTKRFANGCRDLLLRMGFSDFLNLE